MTSKPNYEPDESEPWLDSLLDEVLGGQRPPDLKDRILQEWKASVDNTSSSVDPIDVATIRVQPRAAAPPRRRTRRLTAWSISGIIGLIALLVITAAQLSLDRVPVQPPVAQLRPGAAPSNPTPPKRGPTPSSQDATDRSSTSATPGKPPLRTNLATPDETPEFPGSAEPRRDKSIDPSDPPTQWAKLDASEVIDQINQRLHQAWDGRKITPAPSLADDAWCQRIFSLLLGREPNNIELRDFQSDTSHDRRPRLVDHLLGEQHAQEFANHWSRRWSQWLLAGNLDTSKAIRTGLQGYLATALSSNQPYDDVCAQLIKATGTNDPSRDDYDGATNFMLGLNEKGSAADATSQLCRVMVGQRAGCARCHDDRTRERPQRAFWQLAATIGSVEITVLRPSRGLLRDIEDTRQHLVQFQDSTGETQSVAPGNLVGQPLIASSGASLRTQLADQLVSSDDFSRAAVNRFWAALLHYGFTFPVDDMGQHNPESDHQLVELLSNQFKAHDCDLRQLIRWIALSDAFDRSSAITKANNQDAPTAGGAPLFSRFYYRPVLFTDPAQGLVRLAAGDVPIVTFGPDEAQSQVLNARRQRNPLAGSVGPTVNDLSPDRMGQMLPSHYLSLIRSLAAAPLTPEQQFEHAFLVVQGRLPGEDERAHLAAIWQAADGVAVTALERIFWSLLNTQES